MIDTCLQPAAVEEEEDNDPPLNKIMFYPGSIEAAGIYTAKSWEVAKPRYAPVFYEIDDYASAPDWADPPLAT